MSGKHLTYNGILFGDISFICDTMPVVEDKSRLTNSNLHYDSITKESELPYVKSRTIFFFYEHGLTAYWHILQVILTQSINSISIRNLIFELFTFRFIDLSLRSESNINFQILTKLASLRILTKKTSTGFFSMSHVLKNLLYNFSEKNLVFSIFMYVYYLPPKNLYFYERCSLNQFLVLMYISYFPNRQQT